MSKSIVVLGAGIGGLSQAFELNRLIHDHETLTVVNDAPDFEFTPSNPWVAVGWRKPAQIRLPLEPLLHRHAINFVEGRATRVVADENRIELADGRVIPYDYLVVASGPALAFDEVPGLGPDGYTSSVCKTDHAAETHQAVEQLIKEGGPVVVGAAAGASCFGPAYEYAFILDTALRRAKARHRVPITLVTPEPYIGHLGLDGVGDTKTLLESELRQRHIRWQTNARIDRVSEDTVYVTEVDESGEEHSCTEHAYVHAMVLPAFRGIDALTGVEGLVNPRGFVLVDEFQRNPAYPNIYAVGVCIAIPPVGQTPLPVGVPKTGFMIESMVTAAAQNIRAALDGEEPSARGTWNAVCLADFGDSGVAFVASPQIPPRNVNWASHGRWVHAAKVGFERYFLHKLRRGQNEPFYEKQVLKWLGTDKLEKAG